MDYKRILAATLILTILVLLIAREANSWFHFRWSVFWMNAHDIRWAHVVGALAATYLGFVLRAERWRVLVKSTKTIKTVRLVGPTIVGFAGLALIGRPGEFIRPYLIARKERLSLSSQLATLAVERIFDMFASGIVVASALLFSARLHALPYVAQFERGIAILSALVFAIACSLFILARYGQSFVYGLERILFSFPGWSQKVSRKLRLLTQELGMIRDAQSLVHIVALSVAVWFVSGLSYLEAVHAFPAAARISLGEALLLLGFGLLGSLVQLPGGGSQQLIVIAALTTVFGFGAELAVSCSIVGWLTIYVAPIPVALLLLRHEGLTLGALSGRSHKELVTKNSESDSQVSTAYAVKQAEGTD